MKINRDRVELAMAAAGISTYKDFAQRMGCSRQNLSIIINRGSCSAANVCRMAKVLGVKPQEIAIIKEDNS